MKNSLQFKIGLSYFAIIIAVLVILNTYPLIESQNLVFRSKETLLTGSVKAIESALSGLSELTQSNVEQGPLRIGGDRRKPGDGHGYIGPCAL